MADQSPTRDGPSIPKRGETIQSENAKTAAVARTSGQRGALLVSTATDDFAALRGADPGASGACAVVNRHLAA
jgi:hypothetical protein